MKTEEMVGFFLQSRVKFSLFVAFHLYDEVEFKWRHFFAKSKRRVRVGAGERLELDPIAILFAVKVHMRSKYATALRCENHDGK